MEIGGALRLARVRAGLTQYDVADRLGIRQVSVSLWERGKRKIPDERLKQMLALYGVTLGEAVKMLK